MLKGDAGKPWEDEVGLPYLWFDESNRLFIKDAAAARDASWRDEG
jgi:hypothetical protein